MEEDWLHWRKQFADFIDEKIKVDKFERTQCHYNFLPDHTEVSNPKLPWLSLENLLEPPILTNCMKGRRLIPKKCRIGTRIRFKEYRPLLAKDPGSATKIPAKRFLELPLVKLESELHSSHTTYDKATSPMPNLPDLNYYVVVDGIEDHRSYLVVSGSLELPIIFDFGRVTWDLKFLKLPKSLPFFPRDTRSMEFGEHLSLPSGLQTILPSTRLRFSCLKIPRLKLKTRLYEPSFPNHLPIEEPKFPERLLFSDEINSEQPLIRSYSDEPIESTHFSERPKDFQSIVNRKMLDKSNVISWFERCDNSNIVEREFCESIGVMVISTEVCVVIIEEEDAISTKIEDIIGLSRKFSNVKAIIPIHSESRSMPSKTLLRLINQLLLLSKNVSICLTDCIISTITSLIPRDTSMVRLDPELTVYERLLYQIKGLNHWKAQNLLATSNFSIIETLLN